MGKCSNCKKEILYNRFKMYRGKVLCNECYKTRLERKKAKKEITTQVLAMEDIEDKIRDYVPYGDTKMGETEKDELKTEDA